MYIVGCIFHKIGEILMSYDELEKMIEVSWEKFRKKLVEGKFSYNDIEKAKSDTFFKTFEDMFSKEAEKLAIKLSDIGLILRGANKKNNLNDHTRLIPHPDYAKHNRMNPKDRIFLYLAIDSDVSGGNEQEVIKTILSEIRASKYSDGIATIGEFVITEEAKEKKVIDLRGDYLIPKDESKLNRYICRKIIETQSEPSEIIGVIYANLYLNLLNSKNIYQPVEVETEEERYAEYVPFHAISNLVEQLGYAGLLYRSTVHRGGTNLVLFEKEYANIVEGSMKHVKLEDYL